MMALRRLLCLHNTFWLPPGHPAVRGLAPGLPRLNGRLGSLPCSSISPRHILTATACQKHSTTHNSIPTYGPKPGCSRLALNHYCPVMLQGHQGHRNTLPALIQSEYSSLLVQPGHKQLFLESRSMIHHQAPDGKKQASLQPFILSPKGLYHASPESWKPYLSLIRLDRPIGTWLLFLPCAWSISLAAQPGCLPDPTMLALFAMGSFFMRGAGCTINDMWDRDFDAKVARTKDRPLACGQITQFKALTFLGFQLSAALAVLLTMNWNTVFLGAAAMIPVIIYPLMKRVTYWPQIFLGLTFNWGAIMGWSACQGIPDLSICLPLYASGIAWTLVYDTIYAHQDKEDDILVGVRSTALGLGDQTKPWLLGFGSVMVGGLMMCGIMCDQTWPFFMGVSGIATHLLHQIVSVDLNNADDCSRKFRSNRNLGIMFWATIVIANLLKPQETDEKKDTTEI